MTRKQITKYPAKIDRWMYLVIIIMLAGCIVGPMLEGDFVFSIILAVLVLAMCLFALTGVKYGICGNQFGVRNFYRWTWLPIDKISSIKRKRGFGVQGPVSATLSLNRISITISDRNITKSSMPVEISPKDAEEFIAALKKINPNIVID